VNGHTQAIWEIAYTAARARRLDLQAELVRQYGYVVQGGPFASMVLPERVCRADGDILPKLLGVYEAELHTPLAALVADEPDLVIDIGAAEGFYTAGLARLLPAVRVHAFDPDDQAQDICREAARLNGVESRVSVGGKCSAELLRLLLGRAARPAVVCDAEGQETELIDPAQVPALATTFLIVECHDFLNPAITRTLAQRLESTHDLQLAQESGRDPNAIPMLRSLNSLDRWIAMCEFRPQTMHWLIAKPRRRGGG
jgi:hypothetical protein